MGARVQYPVDGITRLSWLFFMKIFHEAIDSKYSDYVCIPEAVYVRNAWRCQTFTKYAIVVATMQQYSSIPVAPPGASEQLPGVNVPKQPSSWRGAFSTIGILIAAPLIALLLTAFVFQSYEVDGPSMETTLQNRDRLLVWKVPRTLSRITSHNYIPRRDDVIIFVKHDLYEQEGGAEKQLIKRVIGLPGDRVLVQDGHITLYNNQHPDGFNPDANHKYSANIASLTTGNIDIVVPTGEVFVCGDNRTNSLDSRSFGTVSSGDIVGKLVVRIFPINNFTSYLSDN